MISSLGRTLQSVCKVTKKNALTQISFTLIPLLSLPLGSYRGVSLHPQRPPYERADRLDTRGLSRPLFRAFRGSKNALTESALALL